MSQTRFRVVWLPLASLLVLLILPGCLNLVPWLRTPEAPTRTLLPSRTTVVEGPFRIHTDEEAAIAVARAHLARLPEELATVLQVKISVEEPIDIYLVLDRQRLNRFVSQVAYGVPDRRAFFVADQGDLDVFAVLGPRLGEDLRHEATHALLHGSLGDLPLWLDEGLAERFEISPDHATLNPEHLGELKQDDERQWLAELQRLETLQSIDWMTRDDYRTAWVWASYLVDGPDPVGQILFDYLDEKRLGIEDPRPISERLIGHTQTIPDLAAWIFEADQRSGSSRVHQSIVSP